MMRFACVVVALFVLASATRADDTKPNIVFILADDLGREDCGFMGGKEIKTPNIDKLAAAGRSSTRFTCSRCAAPRGRRS